MWCKIKCSFLSKSQNPKIALCGGPIGKLRFFDSIDFIWFYILLAISSHKKGVWLFCCLIYRNNIVEQLFQI